MSMSSQSYTIREGSPYRTALQRMGDAHQNIGVAQSELVMILIALMLYYSGHVQSIIRLAQKYSSYSSYFDVIHPFFNA